LKKLGRKIAQAADGIVHGWMGFPARGVFTVQLAGGGSGAFEIDAHQSAYLAFASRRMHGGYELAETLFLEAMLAKSHCFYDVGANWGYYTLCAATHPEFKGAIHAFDISDQMNMAVSHMADTLGLTDVEVMGYGLSDHSGEVSISADRATQLTKVIAETGHGAVQGVTARIVRLDDVDRPAPDLMKIDVEDHELAVFEGGRKLLEQHRPVILFESRIEGDGGKAGAFLRALGYHIYHLQQRDGPVPGIELLPIDSDSAPSGEHFNLVAVPAGDEARWFGQ
jgi:FkbM family methyltransferase